MSLHKIPRTFEQQMKHDRNEMIIVIIGGLCLIGTIFYLLVVKGF